MTYSRIDNNQRLIVAALRQAGATVQHLHMVGHGCPDLLVSKNGSLYLIEVKSGRGRLTQDEREWHDCWQSDVHIVRSVDDALRVIGAVE